MAITLPANRIGVPQTSRVFFAIKGAAATGGLGAPFQLWIPPGTLDVQYAKRINRYLTRGAWIEEHWGEQLDILSASGSTGMWLHPDCGLTALSTIGKGRHDTEAYKNFEDFLSLYKNNASVYNSKGRIVEVGTILIYYQYCQWSGYFESFNFKETEQYPYRFELDWVFKVQHSLFGV